MSLNFQNKIVFPAPEPSYTTLSSAGQVIYLPRKIMTQVETFFNTSIKKDSSVADSEETKRNRDENVEAYRRKSQANLDFINKKRDE